MKQAVESIAITANALIENATGEYVSADATTGTVAETEKGVVSSIRDNLLLNGGVLVGAIILIVLVWVAIVRSSKKKAEIKAKEEAMKAFKKKYGDVKVNVVATSNNGGAYLASFVRKVTETVVEIPEGGEVPTNVEVKQKSRQNINGKNN